LISHDKAQKVKATKRKAKDGMKEKQQQLQSETRI